MTCFPGAAARQAHRAVQAERAAKPCTLGENRARSEGAELSPITGGHERRPVERMRLRPRALRFRSRVRLACRTARAVSS